jgi:cardiolipin synthase
MRLLRHLPNLFSLARIALAPVVVFAILARQNQAAVCWAAAACATDAIDGELARLFNWRSQAGAYLDPIADKILLSAVYIALGLVSSIPWWLVGIIFVRDILLLVAAGSALVFTKIRQFPPSIWGKISTCFQMLTATVALTAMAFPSLVPHALVNPLVFATAAATIWSGTHYALRSAGKLGDTK